MVRRFANRVRNWLLEPVLESLELPVQPDAASQLALRFHYQRLRDEGRPLPQLSEVGFKVYSQSDEDGILLFLFALIDTCSRRSVEICAGTGIECNTANLILNHGWHGLLVDGDPHNVERGRYFYQRSRHTYVFPPRFASAWITRGNVNQLLTDHGFTGEVDLLSLDLDGVDYWIWDALNVVTPRVVVVEYQDVLGAVRALTVPYADDFSADRYGRTRGMPHFAGASLPAFVKLGRKKGYRLVGANRYGYNAFFVRGDLGDRLLPEADVASCLTHPKTVEGMRDRWPLVKDLPWEEV